MLTATIEDMPKGKGSSGEIVAAMTFWPEVMLELFCSQSIGKNQLHGTPTQETREV